MRLRIADILSSDEFNLLSGLTPKDYTDYAIDHIMFDSRKQNLGTCTLFLALGGDDKHISEARAKGVRIFMLNSEPEIIGKDEIYLITDNVLLSFQKIAKAYRVKQNGLFIGITGTNGKTITKEWTHSILNKYSSTYKSPGSYNSQLGVPLSILGIEEEVNYAIIEAGISRPGEMKLLESIIQPNIGILTTMGDAHSEGFDSFNQKLKEKIILFRDCEKLIYESNEKVGELNYNALLDVEKISWSKTKNSTLYKVSVEKENNAKIIISGKKRASFIFPFKDEASISNIIHVIILCLELGLTEEEIQAHLMDIRPVSMRLELMKAPRNCLLINDSYNSDIISLHSALEFAMMQKNDRGLTLILSEFDDQKDNKQFYDRLLQLIQSYPVDQFFYVGKPSNSLDYDLLFEDTSSLLNYLIKNKLESQLILIKGARRYRLEHIAIFLQENPHRTILETKLESISDNMKYFKSLGEAKHKIMAVVKAGAYGSDSIRIGKYLDNFGIDYLAVAFIEEGIELRKEGIKKPIMVMNPDPSLFFLAAEYDLEPEIFSISQLEKVDFSKKINIHINIDSGMNRLGFKEGELDELVSFLKDKKSVRVASIFSHLSSSDEYKKETLNRGQAYYFDRCFEKLEDKLGYRPLKHICNSHGAIYFPEMHYDMIRVGIGMHGLIAEEGLTCSHRLVTFIAQIKQVKKGESVGYNQGFIADKDMKTATISIGYADGISRKHGKGNSSFYINGMAHKTVGNIAMDTCIIDISGMDVKSGDEVVIFENKEQLFSLCEIAEVIPYEFLCGIGKRVARNSSID